MGRRRTPDEVERVREQATALRLAGVGAKRIAAQLGVSASLVHEVLRGVPPPASLMRERAKDDHRDAAVALRLEGRTYKEIQKELGVSKSSLSLWLRDLPLPSDEQRAELRAREAEEDVPHDDRGIARVLRSDGWLLREIADELGVSVKTACVWCAGLPVPPRATHGGTPESMAEAGRAYWEARRPLMEADRLRAVAEASARVGPIDAAMFDLLAAALYWAEGSKAKPWRRRERVTLINSDPDVIRLWLLWLRGHGVCEDRIKLRVNIHESADVERATEVWAERAGRAVDSFASATLKRHNPKTVRKNTGDDYVGCLVVDVGQSRDLYREIEGLWRGLVTRLLTGVPLEAGCTGRLEGDRSPIA